MVHSHNITFQDYDRDYAYASAYEPVMQLPRASARLLMGLLDLTVGWLCDFIGILSTVNCSATVVRMVADISPKNAEISNVDGVVAFSHGLGWE